MFKGTIGVLTVLCKVAVGMDMGENEMFPRPDIQKPLSRSLHWVCSIIFLLMIPSISCTFFLTRKMKITVILLFCSLVYSSIDLFLLNYRANDGQESSMLLLLKAWFVTGQIMSSLYSLHRISQRRTEFQETGGGMMNICKFFIINNVIVGFLIVCLIPVSYFGTCREGHLGQCSAHGIMGTSFILYGFIYLYPLLVAPKKQNSVTTYSQDFIDSCTMCAYGIVNTFTEHRWGREDWLMHDYQHTAMGILWWCGGLLGILSSWKNKRTVMPSLILMTTGWAMTQHEQKLQISTGVHYFFGLVLMLGSLMRIIEITFILKDKNNSNKDTQSFQYLPSLCLVCSGILFMSANEEQLEIVLGLGAGHSAYIMVILSGAFMVYLWMMVCVKLGALLSARSEKPLEYWELSSMNTESTASC